MFFVSSIFHLILKKQLQQNVDTAIPFFGHIYILSKKSTMQVWTFILTFSIENFIHNNMKKCFSLF